MKEGFGRHYFSVRQEEGVKIIVIICKVTEVNAELVKHIAIEELKERAKVCNSQELIQNTDFVKEENQAHYCYSKQAKTIMQKAEQVTNRSRLNLIHF